MIYIYFLRPKCNKVGWKYHHACELCNISLSLFCHKVYTQSYFDVDNFRKLYGLWIDGGENAIEMKATSLKKVKENIYSVNLRNPSKPSRRLGGGSIFIVKSNVSLMVELLAIWIYYFPARRLLACGYIHLFIRSSAVGLKKISIVKTHFSVLFPSSSEGFRARNIN